MEQKNNVVGWFEIPVTNIERATKFYETVFNFKLTRDKMGISEMAFFPGEMNGPGSGGSLIYCADIYKPSTEGVLIYFNAPSEDLSVELNRVVSAGGKIHRPKTLIRDDIGYMAVFIDTEGNKVALHSRK